MKTRAIVPAFLLVVGSGAPEPQPLGEYPLCEPSAAISIDCPGGSGHCVLVGDNEVTKELFLFEVRDETFVKLGAPALGLGSISDIESFAGLEDGSVLVMGSHSRNKRCKDKEDRRRFAIGEVGSSGFRTTSRVETAPKIRCELLFGAVPADPLRKAVCDRIDEVEDAADEVVETGAACDGIHPPFNAEGAAYVPDGPGKGVWLGLRSPLVSWKGEEHAVLLRMKSLDEFHFDEAILLDLRGWGIRELTVHDGSLWGIAGPAPDGEADFRLWRIQLTRLVPGDALDPTFLESVELPSSSEGLVFVGGGSAYVTIDGDQGDDACIVPGKYSKVEMATSS